MKKKFLLICLEVERLIDYIPENGKDFASFQTMRNVFEASRWTVVFDSDGHSRDYFYREISYPANDKLEGIDGPLEVHAQAIAATIFANLSLNLDSGVRKEALSCYSMWPFCTLEVFLNGDPIKRYAIKYVKKIKPFISKSYDKDMARWDKEEGVINVEIPTLRPKPMCPDDKNFNEESLADLIETYLKDKNISFY